eukprot:1951832-Karenia_brevis.AAC.1
MRKGSTVGASDAKKPESESEEKYESSCDQIQQGREILALQALPEGGPLNAVTKAQLNEFNKKYELDEKAAAALASASEELQDKFVLGGLPASVRRPS